MASELLCSLGQPPEACWVGFLTRKRLWLAIAQAAQPNARLPGRGSVPARSARPSFPPIMTLTNPLPMFTASTSQNPKGGSPVRLSARNAGIWCWGEEKSSSLPSRPRQPVRSNSRFARRMLRSLLPLSVFAPKAQRPAILGFSTRGSPVPMRLWVKWNSIGTPTKEWERLDPTVPIDFRFDHRRRRRGAGLIRYSPADKAWPTSGAARSATTIERGCSPEACQFYPPSIYQPRT